MNGDTLLHRQIHPTFLEADGGVAYFAFRPFPRDEGKLSAYNGDLITAKAAWNHYRTAFKLKSVGVLSISVDECESQGTTQIHDGHGYPEHASIDFTCLSKRKARDAAKKLAEFAMDRGWQFGPVG